MQTENFFQTISKIYFKNKIMTPNFEMTPEMVYTLLVNYKNTPIENIEPLFNILIERFKKRPGIKVFKTSSRGYYCQATNGSFNSAKIKLYIPLKAKNLDENVTKLLEFIRINNINHRTKIAKETRCDNVIIRVENIENANKIINYINQTPELKTALDQNAPLIPVILGIGVTKDSIYSYNMVLSSLIAQIINKKNNITQNEYISNLRQKIMIEIDPELKMIYEIALKAFVNQPLTDILNIKINKKRETKILFKIMETTYNKYSEKQVEKALYEYITNNNSLYFTREENLRTILEETLSPKEVLEIIEKDIGQSNNLKNTITKFVNYIFADKISNKKEENNKQINEYLEHLKKIYKEYGTIELKKELKENYKEKSNEEIYIKILKTIYPTLEQNKINELIKNKTILSLIENIICSNN